MAFTQQFLFDGSGKHFITVTGSWGLDAAPYNGNATSIDTNDRIYFPAYFREDTSYPWLPNSGWIGQYSKLGNLNWQRAIGDSDATTWGGDNELLFSSSLSPDEQYFYVVGHTTPGNGSGIIFKYNTSGSVQWKKQIGDSDDNDFYGSVTDSSGNLYIAGGYDPNAGQGKANIIKLNSSGVIQWQKFLAGTSGYRHMAIDSSNNIYVCGTIDGGPADCLVVKYNTSGSVQWQKRVTRGSSNYWEGSYCVALDSSSNVYITGFSNHDSSSDDQPFLLKMNSSGTFQWARKFGNYGGSSGNTAECCICDQNDNVYVTGRDKTNTSGTDAYIVKLNSSGTVQWKRSLGINGINHNGYSLKIDSRNNIVLGGDFYAASGSGGYGSRDYFLAKLPSDGTKTGTYSLNSGSWVYQSTSMSVGTSSGWSISNAGRSTSNSSLSVSNSSLSEASYTHSSSTTII